MVKAKAVARSQRERRVDWKEEAQIDSFVAPEERVEKTFRQKDSGHEMQPSSPHQMPIRTLLLVI